MTRFEQELSGALGAYWKNRAEQEIAVMQARVDNDEIRTNACGGAFWNCSGGYLPADCAEILSYTNFPFSLKETSRAREAQMDEFLENYRRNYKGPSEEELAEMRAAFGPDTTVVNAITGTEIRL